MLYIVNEESSQRISWNFEKEKQNLPIDSLNKNDDSSINEMPIKFTNVEPMSLTSMPSPEKPIRIQIVSATDPDNINIRLCPWVIY